MVGAFLETKTKQEVTDAALTRKLLSVGVADVADLCASEHFAERDFLVEVAQGSGLRLPGPFARVSAAAARPGGRPARAFEYRRAAPRVGEHDEEVRRDWSRRREQHVAEPPSSESAAALSDLRVADLSWVVAGPVIGRALADFGATVVRVESSTKVETARHMAPFYGGRHGVENSALYINCNAGKLGLALDLATEPAREVVVDLARWADVLVESYTPGLMDRWGLGYQRLAAANPSLIVISSSLMGNSGKYSRLAGFGNIGAAMSGFQHIVGWPDRPPLGPFGPYTDYVGPRLALVALLAALEERRRTGQGCYLDVSQVECGAWFLAPQIAAYQATGVVQGRHGNRDPSWAPHGVFPCRASAPGGADHVAIAIGSDAQFAELCRLIDRPQLAADPAFSTPASRQEHQEELEGVIAAWTARRSADEIEAAGQAAGIPVHRASSSAEFVADPQLAHIGHLIHLPHPLHGEVVVEAPRYRLSDTAATVSKPAPAIGQDTDHVLADFLGYPPERIAALRRSGALK